MQPLLAQAAQETEDTMEQIKKDSVSFLLLHFWNNLIKLSGVSETTQW